jgi:tripartite-type tricarboxylate transporter receptor subunit TctC
VPPPLHGEQKTTCGIIAQVKDGGSTRVRELPDVPTIREAGYPDVVCDVWVGILVPARTPKDVVALLHQEMIRSVAVPGVQDRLVTLGFEPATVGPEQLAALIKAEIPKWADVIQAAGIKTD